MPERHGEQIVESTTEARQGVTGNMSVTCWSGASVALLWLSLSSISYFFCERRGKPLVMSRNFP